MITAVKTTDFKWAAPIARGLRDFGTAIFQSFTGIPDVVVAWSDFIPHPVTFSFPAFTAQFDIYHPFHGKHCRLPNARARFHPSSNR